MKKEPAKLKNLNKPRIEFGKKLRKLRLLKGFTIKSLALKCHTDSSYIGKIERGEINLGFDSLDNIFTALDIQIVQAIFR